MAVSKSILYVLAVVPLALASAPDLLVPAFIPPTNLASDETIKSTAKNVTAQLESLFATGKSPFGSLGGNDTALSVQVVSLSDDKPLLDWHETPGNLNTLAGSTRRVRADSVYRIGSLSKLFTAYTLLLNDGRKYWDTPVSDILPELKGDGKGSEIEHTGWDEVTVGALASQMGGISSGCECTRSCRDGRGTNNYRCLQRLGLPSLHRRRCRPTSSSTAGHSKVFQHTRTTAMLQRGVVTRVSQTAPRVTGIYDGHLRQRRVPSSRLRD